jgi:hypothetical protein
MFKDISSGMWLRCGLFQLEERTFQVSENKGARKLYETMEITEISYDGNKDNYLTRNLAFY